MSTLLWFSIIYTSFFSLIKIYYLLIKLCYLLLTSKNINNITSFTY